MFTSKRVLTLLTAALVSALALAFVVTGYAQTGPESRVSAPTTPSASQFAHDFIGATNMYSQQSHDDGTLVGDAHCVQAAPGQYMCSYLVTVADTSSCHLMQARWTPESPSAITVTLAGRTHRCGTLREAIQSLG
jgi:hypothetical protein